MANFHGKDGTFTIGGSAPAELLSISISEQSNLIEDSAKGDDWVTRRAGRADFTGSFRCYSNYADTAQATLAANASLTIVAQVEDATANQLEITATALVDSVEYESPEGNALATVVCNFSGNGALAKAAIAP